MQTLIDYLEYWAKLQPDTLLYASLDINCNETDSYSYLKFRDRTNQLAEYLSQNRQIKPGDRILLVYPDGLEAIVAFFACVRIGAIPVPVCAPESANHAAMFSRLEVVAGDSGSVVALTSVDFKSRFQPKIPVHQIGMPDKVNSLGDEVV